MVRGTPIDEVLDWSKLELTPAMVLRLYKPGANNSGVVVGEGEGPTGGNAVESQHKSQKIYNTIVRIAL